MAELTPYALRLPPAMKDAAKAMSKIWFKEVTEEGSRTGGGYNGNSINDALNYLLRRGVAGAIQAMQHDLKEWAEERDFWQEVARFFIENPDREDAKAEDFEGEIRRQIEAWDEANHDGEAEGTIFDLEYGVSRKRAMEDLAWKQTQLTNMRAAEKALWAALA